MPEWTTADPPAVWSSPSAETVPSSQAHSVETASAELTAAIEDVAGATAFRYAATDDRGHELDTLKVLAAPDGKGFVGLYHSTGRRLDVPSRSPPTSRGGPGGHARRESMPTIVPPLTGATSWQNHAEHLGFAYYETWEDLLRGSCKDPGRALSPVVAPGADCGAAGTGSTSVPSPGLTPDSARRTSVDS
jgi:hypothetical protein